LVVGAQAWEGSVTDQGGVYTYTLTGALPASRATTNGTGWLDGVLKVGGATVMSATPTGVSVSHITFPAAQVTSSDPNTLDDYAEGSFTATLTGCTTTPTVTTEYVKTGNKVTLSTTADLTATSNATTCTLTGLPARIRPASTRRVIMRIQDNSVWDICAAEIDNTGTITVYKDIADGAFTASGTKGVGRLCVSYII
jgi:hypothetical protein